MSLIVTVAPTLAMGKKNTLRLINEIQRIRYV